MAVKKPSKQQELELLRPDTHMHPLQTSSRPTPVWIARVLIAAVGIVGSAWVAGGPIQHALQWEFVSAADANVAARIHAHAGKFAMAVLQGISLVHGTPRALRSHGGMADSPRQT